MKAVIFDVDGTILDTAEFILQAYEFVFKKYKLDDHLSRNSIDAVMGKSLQETYELLAPELDAQELCDVHRNFQESHLHVVQPFPNTISTLKKLQEHNIKMAVVSTRKRTGLQTLEQTGVMPFLDAVITGDDVTHFKPHPEGIEKALEKIGVKASDAIMVGDTDIDIQAGRNAGTKTAGALYGLGSKQSIELEQPGFLLNDISELPACILEI